MNAATDNPADLLMRQAQVVGIELDAGGMPCAIHNADLLGAWLGADASPDPAPRATLLDELFGPRSTALVLDGMSRMQGATELDLGTQIGRASCRERV